MSLKKVLISFVVLFLGVVLVGCGKEENLAETYIQNISLLNPAAIVEDIQLQKKISGQGSVTWVSSNEAVVTIEEYEDTTLAASFFKGKVTRPAVGEEDVILTLTATFSLDGKSATRDINIKVLAMPAATTIADILEMSSGTEVLVEGVVAAVGPSGFMLDDTTEIIYVYQGSAPVVVVGDTAEVSGTLSIYYSAKQISYPTVTKINTEAGTYTYPTPVKVTADSLASLYNGDSNDFNNYYEITGIIDLMGDYDDVYIRDFENPDIAICVQYSYINKTNTAMFKAKEGATVSFKAYSVALDNAYYDDTVAVMYLDQTFVEYTDTAAYVTVSGRNMIDIVNPRQYTANLFPSTATATVVWSTSDETIATVDQTGLVTGVAVGDVDIIATIGTITNKKTITVVEELADPTAVSITGEAEVTEFTTTDYVSAVEPVNADPAVTWSVSDETIATIDQTGKLTAIKVGSVTISATATGTTVVGTKDVDVVAMSTVDIATLNPTLTATPQTTSIKGEVVGIAAKGWYLADNTGYVYVHLNAAPTNVELGDTVRLAVKKAQIYFNTTNYVYQMDARTATDMNIYEITETFTPLAAETKTVASFEYLPKTTVTVEVMNAMATMSIYGSKWVEVTGTVVKGGSNNNTYLEVGTDKVMIDYNSTAAALARLDYLVGDEITLKGLIYGYHKTNGWSITFFNREGDLKQGETVLEVKPAIMYVDEIEDEMAGYYPVEVEKDMTFDFASTLYPTTAFTYSSSNAAVLSDAGVVTRGATNTNVTITITVYLDGNTSGTASGTIEVVVTVLAAGAVPLETMYSTGFEAPDFETGTVYNNQTPILRGPTGLQWAVTMGRPSTTAGAYITGAQGIQMRSYTAAPDTYGSAVTDFNTTNAHKVTFKARGETSTSMKVYYSTDDGVTWIGEETFTVSTTAADFIYNLPEGGVNNVRFKFEHPYKGVAGKLTIDDVVILGIPAD